MFVDGDPTVDTQELAGAEVQEGDHLMETLGSTFTEKLFQTASQTKFQQTRRQIHLERVKHGLKDRPKTKKLIDSRCDWGGAETIAAEG